LALYYLETSALVKLYIREPGTDQLLRLASRAANHRFAVLSLTQVEFRSAIRKRERIRDIEDALASELIARFEEHLETKYVSQTVNSSVLDAAKALIDRYALRAYDAVQLAGCLGLKRGAGKQAPTFICADHALIQAAAAEGLEVLNPIDERLQ
jgi:predicted nucleic acid-binding protein